MRQVFKALGFIHSYGCMHRDVKLDNLKCALPSVCTDVYRLPSMIIKVRQSVLKKTCDTFLRYRNRGVPKYKSNSNSNFDSRETVKAPLQVYSECCLFPFARVYTSSQQSCGPGVLHGELPRQFMCGGEMWVLCWLGQLVFH